MDPTKPCPFCNPAPEDVIFVAPGVIAIWDKFPVSKGHALLIPVRHVGTWLEATAEERRALTDNIIKVIDQITIFHSDGEDLGFNLGVNVGTLAGQTVPHLHVHIIPRRKGDVKDPRGGVRHVIAERAQDNLGVFAVQNRVTREFLKGADMMEAYYSSNIADAVLFNTRQEAEEACGWHDHSSEQLLVPVPVQVSIA